MNEPEPRNDWLDRLARFNEHFGRFVRDAFGVLLIAVALMTFLALGRYTQGALLTPWADVLSLWFGWGAYLVGVAIGWSGFSLLRRSGTLLGWGRVFALELASFFTLGLLAAIGGNSLLRAEAGADGGRVGWGLVKFFWEILPLGNVWGTLLIIILWLLAVMTGFGLWAVLERWLLKLSGEETPVEIVVSHNVQKDASEKPARQPRKKQSPALPPEFRKTLRASDHQDKKPSAPRNRDERLPSLNILLADQNARPDERTINQTAGLIEKTLAEFGISAIVIGFRVGPTVTQFAVQPGFMKKPGTTTEEEAQQIKVRVAQIASLQKDLTLALSAERLRIEAPVPGKPYVGIEVPNTHSSVVRMRSILETDAFHKVAAPLALALGRDVSGAPLVADLSRMPHLLIAGATGSGKSVCITALAACLAMNNPPEDLRMVMIDSKMVELLRFNGLPHLYGKVETNIDRILGVLRWVVVEMEHRYRLLEGAHARDLETYNRKLSRKKEGVPLPRIVVLIDELADLMMSAPDQTEHNLVRLAQMARATGIHLIVATQRPSTDVVTGLIKANFPARLAFAVASGVDSRVILDTSGAESLLGRGDLLLLNPEVGNPIRAQGVMITDMEIERLISHWQKSVDETDDTPPWEKLLTEPDENEDEGLIEQAVSIVRSGQRASASLLQRRLRIGYPRAARLLDQLEEMGVVGPRWAAARSEMCCWVQMMKMNSMEAKSKLLMEKPAGDLTTRKTLTDYLRLWFKWVLDPLGRFFNWLGLTPNMMTIVGMMGNTVGAYYLARGEMVTGGLFVLLMTPIDALDGTMARLRGEASDWGAFVDSVSDRYSELIIYGGLLYYFLSIGETLGGMLTFGAAAGSVLVSYVKARAEGLGFGAKVGLLTRAERYIVLAPSLVFNQLYIGLTIIAVLANITALQRIWFVRRQAHERVRFTSKGNS